ncbi:MAG: GNAT family N-acetyltransferase [Caldilineaceae bacterium]
MMKPNLPIIRLATEDDVAAIVALTDAAYRKFLPRLGRKPQPMTTDYQQFIKQHSMWLLEIDQRLVGVLALKHEIDSLLIYSVAIDPTEQKRGYGRLLLAHAEDEAKQAGYRSVRLYTNVLMEENIALYKRIGYQETRREVLSDRTIVHMSKQLF